MARGKKKRAQVDSTAIPRSPLKPEVVAKLVEEGKSNVIANYCYHFGDPEAKPEPVEGEVCHKVSTETFNCTVWEDPATKARLTGFNEEGFAELVLGCAMSPYLRFESYRQAWLKRGRKINPLKASKRGVR
jgi:hypothetical protein